MNRLWVVFVCSALAAQDPKKPETDDPASGEKAMTGSAEIGYRFVPSLSGNVDTYRSVVNLGEGPKMFATDLRFAGAGVKLFDEASLTMRDWGGEPNSTLRTEVRKANVYNLAAEYRNFAHFNRLPSFANPFLGTGVWWNQNAFDTRIRTVDTRLEVAPSARVSPFFAFARNSERGSGGWVFSAEGNEYAVPSLYSYSNSAYSGGLLLRFGRWSATLEQGALNFRDDQSSEESITNPGNLGRPFLGRSLGLDRLAEQYRVRGDSPFSRASMAASPVRWLELSAAFAYSNPRTTATYENRATGVFIAPGTLQEASGLSGQSDGRASGARPSGLLRVEVRPARRWRLVHFYRTDRFETSASARLLDRFLSATAPATFASSAADRLKVNESRRELDAFFDVTRSLTLRLGHRQQWGDAIVRSSAFSSEPFGAGKLNRQVGVAGVTYRTKILRFNADFERAGTSEAYFRNSLRDYSKVRARVSYTPGRDWRTSFEYLWLRNESPGGGWQFESRAATASLEWLPASSNAYSVLASYTRSGMDSSIDIVAPQSFLTERSNFREAGHSGTLFLALQPGKWSAHQPGFRIGGTVHVNNRSRPTNYYSPQARVSLPLSRLVSANAEWRWFSLSQRLYGFESFATHQLVVSLTLAR